MLFVTSPSQFAQQLETLCTHAGAIDALIDRHVEQTSLWMPGDFLDFGDDEQLTELKQLRDRARGLDASARVAVMLNLLTEEGLPHFHRLIAQHTGTDSVLQRWCGIWTAEEDRHGNVLRDYARDAALFHISALDKMQYEFLVAGFHPDWAGSPYRLFAYTSLQERATQMSHGHTARKVARQEPLLQRVLAHLAGDEHRHCAFYRDVFALILQHDVDGGLLELQRVAPVLSMPGKTIPGYQMMSEVERRGGIFGPREYAGIVQESLDYWQIGSLMPDSGAACDAQAQLMALPDRLLKLADRLDSRSKKKSFEFDFLRLPDAVLQ